VNETVSKQNERRINSEIFIARLVFSYPIEYRVMNASCMRNVMCLPFVCISCWWNSLLAVVVDGPLQGKNLSPGPLYHLSLYGYLRL